MGKLLKTHGISQHLLLLFTNFLLLLSPASSDTYLIDCGSATESTSFENRTFQADSNSSSFSFISTTSFSARDQNPPQNSSALYHTARIFSGQSYYQFHIKENGTYFMRLHFSTFQSRDYARWTPFSTVNYNLAAADFEVSAYDVSIFNFSSNLDTEIVIQEFILNINSGTFTLSFLPAAPTSSDRTPFAFISAIELLPTPSNLIPNSVEKLNKLADYILKNVYRVNVGGPEIAPSGDSLFRQWTSDDGLLLHNNSAIPVNFSGSLNYLPGLSNNATAPTDVYRSGRKPANLGTVVQNFNITWMFEGISLDHHYFIRLHFCDIISKSSSDLNFNIYVSSIAKENFQPGSMTNQIPHTPLYMDIVADPSSTSQMPISIIPSQMASTGKQNAILNGVEIMQMISIKKNTKPNKKPLILIASVTGGSVFIGLAVLTVFILLKKRHKPLQKKGVAEEATSAYSYGTTLTYGSRSPHNFGLQICFADLKCATDNFDERCVIGHGGFGKVYRGMLKDGTVVAVKRASPDSKQGLQEFQAEIMVLSRIRHIHLVCLIGYCEEESEMILVYEFMEKGTLQKHLYGSDLPCLSWKQRLEICIGAARGLHYLHTGSYQAIIHRDVKSSNILLDDDYTAKVADFGLSKLGPTFSQTHVSTNVKGSFGYLDPEYFKRHQLTEKSDVYSFGVVLLEVLSARPAIDTTRSSGKHSLVEWGMKLHRRGMMEKFVDQRIKDQIHPSALRNIEETIVKCLADYGVDRPSMGEVLWSLEYALRLQQTALGSREPHEDSNTSIDDFGQGVRRVPSSSVRMVGVGEGESDDETGFSSGRIFSQLVKSEGR